jgi:hypothetical protein
VFPCWDEREDASSFWANAGADRQKTVIEKIQSNVKMLLKATYSFTFLLDSAYLVHRLPVSPGLPVSGIYDEAASSTGGFRVQGSGFKPCGVVES